MIDRIGTRKYKSIVQRWRLDVIQCQPTNGGEIPVSRKVKHGLPLFIREVVLFEIPVRRYISIITLMNNGPDYLLGI